MRAGGVIAVLFASGCYLVHEREVPIDAAALDAPVIDARVVDVTTDTIDAPFCTPGMPCDCFGGGELIWDGVYYSIGDATTISGYGFPGQGWGNDLHLGARCAGEYTITATVEARGSHCQLVSVQTFATIRDPHTGARARMPVWTANDACANEALTMTGGRTCLSLSWNATGGGSGSTSLGCFAEFGPFGCFGGPNCPSGVFGSGAAGDWTF